MMRHLFLILILVCTGCSLDWPDPAQGTYECAADADCADGYYCKTDIGTCEAESESCADGSHPEGDTCVPDNDVLSCWDGAQANDCEEDAPDNSNATCTEVVENSGTYECGFTCRDGFELVDFECVEVFACPGGEHLSGDVCVEDNSLTDCWNGSEGFDCVANAPDFSAGLCVPDSNTGFFICDFVCNDGFYHDQNTCVCPEGEHEDEGSCYPKDDVEHCWNGESSIDCTASVIPMHAQATCVEINSGEFSSFTCDFQCDLGFVENNNQCDEIVECAAGQHPVENICYENSDVQHCYNGNASQNCFDVAIPEGSTPTCMGIGDDLYTCDYICDEDREPFNGGCVLRPENMVFVSEGSFWMGCDESDPQSDTECQNREKPYHAVYLSAFFIDTYEVTASQFKACVDAGGCSYGAQPGDSTYNVAGKEDHPINKVTHMEAVAYCDWVNKRLPSEAEWEKAARGVEGDKYPWGNGAKSCDLAVINGCEGNTWSVGSLPAGASTYGAMDMSGNVMEWVQDWAGDNYFSQTPTDGWFNPEGPESNVDNRKITKGGAYAKPDSGNSYSHRAAWRGVKAVDDRSPLTGFRCAVSLSL